MSRRLYPKIGHLPGSRTGPSDRTVPRALAARCLIAGTAGDEVVVQEKLDGSCVVVARRGGALLALGREGLPCAASKNESRRAFDRWVEEHSARFEFLGEGEMLVCEWLLWSHGTRYVLPHEPVVVLDLYAAGGERLGIDRVRARTTTAQLTMPRLLHRGGPLGLESALALLGPHGAHGATDRAEGVVYRIERRGVLVGIAKYVRPGKIDGLYLPDQTGEAPVLNTWTEQPL